MKYLSFDIECANCFEGIGKICEFGYALADENFKIIYANDIPMSPGKREKFYLTGRKNRSDVILAYPLDHYRSQPEFPNFYETIKNILTKKDQAIIGFSVSNDINYIDGSIKRYHLEPFDYKAIDVQRLVKHYYPDFKKYGLEICAEKLGIKEKMINLNEHSSQDDSKLTVYVLEKLLQNKNKTLDEAILDCPSALIVASEYIKELEDKRLAKAKDQTWKNLIKKYATFAVENKESIGKRIDVSSVIIHDDALLTKVIEIIENNNLIPVRGVSKSDFLIVKDEEDKNRMLSILKIPYKGEIITLDDFINKFTTK